MKKNIKNAVKTAKNIEKKRDTPPHNGKKIDQIIVSRDTSYAITYSMADSSIVAWIIDIDEIEIHQKCGVYYKIERNCFIFEFVLYKNILLYRYYERDPKLDMSYRVG